MDKIGQILKAARQGKHLTVAQVAHETRASLKYIEAIEADQLGVFPAPIYALGFIRLYAECVGEDVRRLEKLFRDMAAREMGAAPAPAPEKTSAAPAPAAPPRAAAQEPAPGPLWKGAAETERADRAGWWTALRNGMRWLEFEDRWASLSSIRLPVETWKTLLAAAGMTLLVIVAAALLGWHLLSKNGGTPAGASPHWLAEPPAPYLPAE